MSNSKPGGAIWKTGVHRVSLGGRPVRLAAPQYSLIQNYNLMKRKIKENGYIPIGIDHIPEEVLSSNPVLKKILKKQALDPYDVGKITRVTTDGDSIRIDDAEFTNPIVQKLFENGKLEAWSVVQDVRSSKCSNEKADLVAEYFGDIDRVDLVGKGGCETCLVEPGEIPEGYERINASFMEVDILTKETKDKKDEEMENNKDEHVNVDSSNKEDEKENNKDESVKDPLEVLQDKVNRLTDTVGTLTETVTGIVEGTIEAKLPEKVEAKLKEVDKLKMEASEAKVIAQIDGKIQAGYVTPAMKDGLVKAGLSMDPEDFTELLAGYKEKLWDPERHADHSHDDGDKVLSLDTIRNARKKGRY